MALPISVALHSCDPREVTGFRRLFLNSPEITPAKPIRRNPGEGNEILDKISLPEGSRKVYQQYEESLREKARQHPSLRER